MAKSERNSTKTRKRALVYFFLNGELHKKLHINRGADEIMAWNFSMHKRMVYSYTDVKRRHEPAFTMVETGKMLNRGRLALERAILRGDIAEPQHVYALNEGKKKYQYMFSEKDILDAHAYFSGVHFGRPRSDGLVAPKRLPTVRELRAMIRQEEMLYVRDGDKFIPTWAAPDI